MTARSYRHGRPGPTATAAFAGLFALAFTGAADAQGLRASVGTCPPLDQIPANMTLEQLPVLCGVGGPQADGVVTLSETLAFITYTNSDAPSRDLQSFVYGHYAPTVTYYGKRNVSREAVLQDKQRWFQRWSSWRVVTAPESATLTKLPNDSYELQYDIDYAWFGKPGTRDDGKVLSGRARVVRILTEEGGRMVIHLEDTILTY